MSRKRLSARNRVQCFEDAKSICHICGGKIHVSEAWEVSHPIPLAAGGEDVPENRRPAHKKCHGKQTAEIDAPRIAKTRRQYQKNLGVKSSRPMRHPTLRKRMDGTVVTR